MSGLRPLLACYGGGHAHIVAPLTKALIARGDQPTVIGFTTAYKELQRQGLSVNNVTALLDSENDAEWLELAAPFVKGLSHPDITQEETLTYFALGLRDLAGKIGLDAAQKSILSNGRKAFEPVEVMQRYLAKHRPDIVITTTSPRFETALLKAARQENIPSLAIGDLFLVKEREWILEPEYAEYLAVLSDEVAQDLVTDSFPKERLKVTGNPAFDALTSISQNNAKRKVLRKELGLTGKSVILYPAPSSDVSMIGRPFMKTIDVVAKLEELCHAQPKHAYLVRPHPNNPFSLADSSITGYLDDVSQLSAEDAILVSDIVLVEASTMGLQAALAGRNVICVGFSDYVHYPKYGLAMSADNLSEAIRYIANKEFAHSANFAMPPLGAATDNVLSYIDDILSA